MKYGQKFKFLSDMHLSTPVIPKNSIKSRDSLFRESFRKQAIYHGVADDCVIDKDTFAEISCITGCFKSGDNWIVYDTDERSQVYGEKKYSDLILAYTDIANRLGFSFQVPRIKSARTRTYSSIDAFSLICKSASVKFDETVELHVRLGVDSRRPDQLVRGSVILPHGTGKSPRVLVFATGNNVQVARAAGADYVGGIDLANRILKENWFDFDVVVASPDMMGTVNRLGKLLGPKGLMPSPKAGTVTTDLSKAIKGIKASKIEYRLDKLNMIHCPIGKVSFGSTKLNDNFDTMIASIIKAKPASIKGQYIRSCVTTASSMGPRIKISLEGLN